MAYTVMAYVFMASIVVARNRPQHGAAGSLTVHWSKSPGAGKTFAVRQLAHSMQRSYVFVPVNTSITAGQLIERIEECARFHELNADTQRSAGAWLPSVPTGLFVL